MGFVLLLFTGTGQQSDYRLHLLYVVYGHGVHFIIVAYNSSNKNIGLLVFLMRRGQTVRW